MYISPFVTQNLDIFLGLQQRLYEKKWVRETEIFFSHLGESKKTKNMFSLSVCVCVCMRVRARVRARTCAHMRTDMCVVQIKLLSFIQTYGSAPVIDLKDEYSMMSLIFFFYF